MIADLKGAIVNALNAVGAEQVNFSRSLTNKRRPDAQRRTPKGGGNAYYKYNYGRKTRQAHPGGWADVTGTLANGYGFDVEANNIKATLTIRNTVEYAEYLDGKKKFDGGKYWVLSGLLEDNRIQESFDRKFNLTFKDKL